MPRKRKPTQPPTAAPGQVYGQGIEQTQAMKAVPLADMDARRRLATSAPAGPPAGPPPASPAGGPAAAPSGQAAAGPSFAAALAAAQQMRPPQGMLQQVAANPAGVPAASPSKINGGITADLWAQLADMTGDPSFLRLAQQARMVR